MKYIKVTNKTKRTKPLRILNSEATVESVIVAPNQSIIIGEYRKSLEGYYRFITKAGFIIETVGSTSVSIANKNTDDMSKHTRIVENENDSTVTENTKDEAPIDVVESEVIESNVEENVEIQEDNSSIVDSDTENTNTPSSTAPKKRRNKKSTESNEETGDING